MKRLFCALKVRPTEAVREVLADFRETMAGERIKWVHPENLHITLKFFGDTPGHKEPAIVEALEQAAAAATPFHFQLKGCGTFGNPRMPRVIWLGINQGAGLKNVYHKVNRALEPLGHLPDKKLFVPHLTVGRIKHLTETETLRGLIEEYRDTVFGNVPVGEFFLFQSTLRPEGPEYRVLKSFRMVTGDSY